MNILVTGGAGYLGSVLIPKLLARGHRVRVLDIGYFGVGHLRAFRPPVELVRDDIRRVGLDAAFRQELLSECECIIHLAAVSNDPSADLNPALTEEINFQATCVLADSARKSKIKFLFSSSCSVYGEASMEINEEGSANPLTTYAISKVKAEKALLAMGNSSWAPLVLRNGTLFGYSARMRFDLVVNIFSLYSTLYNEIKIFGDGQHWRPFLHVGDCARAFIYFAEKPTCRYSCYNISHQNLRVTDLANVFQRINPKLKISKLETADRDTRNYQVSTQRMREEGFQTRCDVQQGAEEMIDAIVSGLITDPESVYYRNAKWLKELTQIGSKNPREIMNLMEILAQMRQPSRP